MNTLDLIRGRHAERSVQPALSMEEWLTYFTYSGLTYQVGQNRMLGGKGEQIGSSFQSLIEGAYRRSGIVFAVEMARLLHFAEARFVFRQRRRGRSGLFFGTEELAILETPWPGGTTGDLLTKMLVQADLAGSSFCTRVGDHLKLLRPDWMTVVVGSQRDEDVGPWDPSAELLGYLYHPKGLLSGEEPIVYLPQEVAHFAPIPDPAFQYRGMSWLEPVIREIQGDQAATEHKLAFFENGATPSMVVTLDITDPNLYKQWIDLFREQSEGASNAYKTMFLAASTKPLVVGADFQQLDFKQTVGVSETRIAAAGGVPPVVVGLSEGLQGSSLNAGNYQQARRRFADGTMRPLWRNIAGSLSRLLRVPGGSELWYDTTDIAFLREDEEVEARITQTKAAAARQLVDAGYLPQSVIDAVESGDLSRLEHSGLYSVQLQPPGTPAQAPSTNGAAIEAARRELEGAK